MHVQAHGWGRGQRREEEKERGKEGGEHYYFSGFVFVFLCFCGVFCRRAVKQV